LNFTYHFFASLFLTQQGVSEALQSAFILTTPTNSEATAKFVALEPPFPDHLQKRWTAWS